MQHRILVAGSFLLAAVAWAPSVSAQTEQHSHKSIVPCATAATHAGGAYLVTPGGAAEKILRATPASAPAPQKVTHSMPHAKTHAAPTAPKVQARHTAPAHGRAGCQPRLAHTR